VTIQTHGMPWPIRLFLGYAFLILAGIGLSLRFVVDQAIAAPVSPLGVIVMVLLAYTIFTTTLVLQRKVAARRLALGLASLTIPPIPWAAAAGFWPIALFFLALGGLLFRGLRSPKATAWLVEP
jgi:predicted lysophospholipase L1 biosynthesis ABC-type transport system permease subunit